MNPAEATLPVWDLSRLFAGPGDPALVAAIEAFVPTAKEFADRWRGKVAGQDAEGLLEALRNYEEVARSPAAAYMYAHLRYAADSESAENVALLQRIMERANEAHRIALFFPLELDAIPDDRFETLVASQTLRPYAHFLRHGREEKPHRLTEPVESALALKSLTGRTAHVQLYSRLTASFRFPSPLEEGRQLTGSELLALLKHPDRGVRRRALETYMETYEGERLVISSVWNALALDHRQDVELRSYENLLAPTNLANEITPRAVLALLETSRAHYGLAGRYYRWKAKTLGVEKLWSSDLVAPLPGGSEDVVDFETARGWVLDAFGAFHPRFREIAGDFFSEKRIDAPPRPGKSGGAFCSAATPDLPVYVLVNFTGKLRDAATLAHELGHGVHFTLAAGQPLLEYSPALVTAETASVFGELLLVRELLSRDLDVVSRRNLIAERVEDILATTFRQAMYTDFELAAHKKCAEGYAPPETMCALWAEQLEALYGDSVETLEASRWAWSAIPHFIHTRFYCYAYTFGELLVLSLFGRYQEEGEAFAPKLIAMLEAGGARSPGELVRAFGYDLEDPGFWAGGYRVLEELIAGLERS
jgi:oligoendopeptidase F